MPSGKPGQLRVSGMRRARLPPASSNSTLRRKRARYVAATSPAGPAPMMMQSYTRSLRPLFRLPAGIVSGRRASRRSVCRQGSGRWRQLIRHHVEHLRIHHLAQVGALDGDELAGRADLGTRLPGDYAVDPAVDRGDGDGLALAQEAT